MEAIHGIWQPFVDDLGGYFSCIQQNSFATCYTEYDALTVGYIIVLCLVIYCFVWSLIGQNCSKVDQIWSITPILFCWHFYLHHAVQSPAPAGNNNDIFGFIAHKRLFLLSVLVSIWGIRLTYNFWKKGG